MIGAVVGLVVGLVLGVFLALLGAAVREFQHLGYLEAELGIEPTTDGVERRWLAVRAAARRRARG